MSVAFGIDKLRGQAAERARVGLASYLASLHLRFRNGVHATTRVYTCRAWRGAHGALSPLGMEWNEPDVPGETHLGDVGWAADAALVARIDDELARGGAVRLFLFNGDSDLCFEELLVPA